MQRKNSPENVIVLSCLLLLTLMMVLFVPDDQKGWGAFCGSVAILYAILAGKGNKE